jgi:hypothetical protein
VLHRHQARPQASFTIVLLRCLTFVLLSMHPSMRQAPLPLQEFGNRPGAFPHNPAKLVGVKVANSFETEQGPIVFGGRITEYLFARITGQGMTPL